MLKSDRTKDSSKDPIAANLISQARGKASDQGVSPYSDGYRAT